MKADAMKHIKRVIPALLIILMFSLFICFPVSASQENKAVEGKTDSYIEKIEPRFFTEEPETALIQCYDVNEDGLVAVCMVSGYCKNSALVYDSDGHFLYGYEINDSGLTVVHWRDSDLQLCVISDNMLVTADGKGNIKSFDFGVIFSSSSCAVSLKPFSAFVFIITGVPSAIFVIGS